MGDALAQVSLVTGAGRGIGAAVAYRLAAAGHAVCVNYVADAACAEQVVAQIEAAGGRAIAMRADIGDPHQIAPLFARIDTELGRLTGLVNNAGISGGRSSLLDLDPATLAHVISVNLTGAILCMQQAARRMATSQGGAGGSIVNLSSMAARSGGFRLAHYAASKAGLEGATIAASRELAVDGIRVNAVSPGVIATDQMPLDDAKWVARTEATIPVGRLGTAAEVAEMIHWLMSDAASYITGAILPINGGR